MKKTPILIALSLLGGLASAQTGLIAHYPLDSTTLDIGPNALHGTAYGSPVATTDRHGTPNGAIHFDGIDDNIYLGTSSLLKPTAAVSASLWAYVENWSALSDWRTMLSNTESGGFGLFVNGGAGVVESEVRRNGSYGVATYPLSNISAGWHHFAFTYDGRYNRLYIDGALVGTDDAGGSYAIDYSYPGNNTLIGQEAGQVFGEGDFFMGKMDDVRIFNGALSSVEVEELSSFGTGVGQFSTIRELSIHPSPASETAFLRLYIPVGGRGSMSITDLRGSELRQMDLGSLSAGMQEHAIDLHDLASGAYLIKVKVGAASWVGKLAVAH